MVFFNQRSSGGYVKGSKKKVKWYLLSTTAFYVTVWLSFVSAIASRMIHNSISHFGQSACWSGSLLVCLLVCHIFLSWGFTHLFFLRFKALVIVNHFGYSFDLFHFHSFHFHPFHFNSFHFHSYHFHSFHFHSYHLFHFISFISNSQN